MDDLLDIFARLEGAPGPTALATLLKGSGAGSARIGARLILKAAEGAPGTELEATVQDVVVGGEAQVLAGEFGPEWGAWRGAVEVLVERMVPGKLPPWLHFCSQVLRRGGNCVLATVGEVEGGAPYALGDRFAYDERNHGLLPMDARLSLDLQRACQAVRETGQPAWRRFDLPCGALGVGLEPIASPLP